jgi:hypothetical protein
VEEAMTELRRAIDYDDRGTQAAHMVLIELGQVLGSFREHFVVIGGFVPSLLMPGATPKHIGTTDIDLALNPEGLEEEQYVSFVHAMEDAGYRRGEDAGTLPFQLVREVDLQDSGAPVRVIVDLLMPREAKTRHKKSPTLDKFRVVKGDGIRVALEHNHRTVLSGRMPDTRPNEVMVLVASIPALLVMKGYALDGRDKPKDAYDIYFAIRHFKDGPRALAEVCKPLLADPIAKEGFGHIEGKFRNRDAFGPHTVRQFLEESDGLSGMTPDQMQTDAFGQVSLWLSALGLK